MIDIAAVPESVKAKKENFVTGGIGGSVLHIIAATSLVPFLLVILSLLDQICIFKSVEIGIDQLNEKRSKKFNLCQLSSAFLDTLPYAYPFQFYSHSGSTSLNSLLRRLVWEFIILILPQLYCMTIASKTCILKHFFAFICEKLRISIPLHWSLSSPLFFFFLGYLILASIVVILNYRLIKLKKTVNQKIQNHKAWFEEINRDCEVKEVKSPIFFISHYKGTIMLISVIAILAVDFHNIFPKEFVKTEQYGTSVMDLGVGCMIFASALTSLYAREGKWEKEERSLAKRNSFVTILKKISPYVVLGSSRLILHQNLNYQEHASEYGVHWNFLLTQASLILILYILGQAKIGHSGLRVLAFGLLTSYQYLLKSFAPSYLAKEITYHFNEDITIATTDDQSSNFEVITMTDYIFHDTRNPHSFFSMNREGILSLLGYTTIYLIGQDIGYSIVFPFVKEVQSIQKSLQLALTFNMVDGSKILPDSQKIPYTDQCVKEVKKPINKAPEKQPLPKEEVEEKDHRNKGLDNKKLIHNLSVNLLKVTLCSYCIYYFADTKIQTISRRLMNMSYVAWCISFNSFQMLLFSFLSGSISYNSNDCIILRHIDVLRQKVEKQKSNVTKAKPLKGQKQDQERLLVSLAYSSTRSLLLEAINRNLFPFFILCNLFTGIINLTLPTSEMEPFSAFCILTIYLFCTLLIVTYLDVKLNMTLKL